MHMISIRAVFTFATISLLGACSFDEDSDREAPPVAPAMPAGQLGDAVVPERYVLDLTIIPERETFSGRVRIDVEINRPATVIWLHGNRLEVERAWLVSDGTRIGAEYQQVDPTGIARLELDSVPDAGPAELHFVYDAPFDRSLEGLYKVTDGGDDYAFTQFQATSARLAFPGFDEPAFKTPFEIHVTARPEHEVITATAETGSQPVNGDAAGARLVRRSFEPTPPLPTYLIAFAVGPLDVVEWQPVPANEIRPVPLPLRGVAARGKGGRLDYALANTARLVETLERYFDYPMPYPKLDLIAVPDFAAGAMENVGAITYRETRLFIDTDDSIARRRAYASIHAHELAHQWFGNLVTPRWWDDLWLNESFATWMAARAVEQAFPELAFEDTLLGRSLGVMGSDSLATARRIREPIESNHDIANAFDGITYAKGGAVLAMFESWLGEDAFRDGVRVHVRRFAHGVADVDDFLQSLADGSGRPDVVEAFRGFLFQPGVPLVSVNLDCASGPALEITQQRYLPLGSPAERETHWSIPLCVRHGRGDGPAARHCELISGPAGRVELPVESCPDWVMPNAGGAGYYRFTMPAGGWSALAEHFAALEAAEVRAAWDSLAAGFRAGEAEIASLVDLARVMAAHTDRQAASAPLGELAYLHRYLALNDAARAGLEALVRSLYAARLDELGLARQPDEPAETGLLRASIADAVALLGRDPELRSRLADSADRYLASRDAQAAGIDPGLIGPALTVRVEHGDAEFARELFERALADGDATFRGRVFGALAASPDQRTGEMLRAHIGDARLRDSEASGLAFGMARNRHQLEAMWQWIQSETSRELLLERIPTWRKGAIAGLAAGFCSAERAAEVETLFTGRIETLEGGPRSLAQTLERVRLCGALKQARGGEVSEFFSEAENGE